MRTEQFEEVINNRIETCKSVLCSKAEEYATDDRLHNFKVAGELQKCTAVKALGGMMAKHTVSVYDLIDDYEQGKAISKELSADDDLLWADSIDDAKQQIEEMLIEHWKDEIEYLEDRLKEFQEKNKRRKSNAS